MRLYTIRCILFWLRLFFKIRIKSWYISQRRYNCPENKIISKFIILGGIKYVRTNLQRELIPAYLTKNNMPIFTTVTVKAKPRVCLPPSDGVALWIWIRLFTKIKNRNNDDDDDDDDDDDNNTTIMMMMVVVMMIMIKNSSRHSYTCMYKL